MILRFEPDGTASAVYTETMDLGALGGVQIARASHVEPNPDASWSADLGPIGGPLLGPYPRRSDALAAEVAWLERWLERDRT